MMGLIQEFLCETKDLSFNSGFNSEPVKRI